MASGILFILALFACVLLHELGHALAARRYGSPTRDITLLPIGGVARLERMPDRPAQELWVALAGPAVNLLIAALLLVWLLATRSFVPLDTLGVASGSFVERLMIVNVFLVVFNMIPAFPMDGGRVLRALLARRMDYPRATRIAAGIGQGLALCFGVVGLFANPFLVLIAVFVWFGAAQESAAVQVRSALCESRVGTAMITDYRSLDPSETVGRAAELAVTGSQSHFPVVEQGRLVGLLSYDRLREVLSREGPSALVGRVSEGVAVAFHPQERLDSAFERLQVAGLQIAPVLIDGSVVGVLTVDNVLAYLRLREAMGGRKGDSEGPNKPLHQALEPR
jgi:Zn-dependent protease/CBS domain-containing protein